MDKAANTKRIAKNTLFLYVRMLVIMGVSLFTFRELLKMLGVDDYGTYNVVGGVVILFSFISNALTQSNQRFLSYNIGKGNKEGIGKVFSMIVNIQIILGIVILILAETIGLWFINYKMNFANVSMTAVNWVYQFSILTFLIQLLQIPFTSLLISYERMSFFSYFSIGEAMVKLGVVLSLGLVTNGRLVLYAGLLTASASLIFLVYSGYGYFTFKDCRYRRNWDSAYFKEITSFSGWNILGGIGTVGASQGINILFNLFCGVVVNAAMGVAHQVNSAVFSLVGNIQTAFNPQIIKSYAANEEEYFLSLIFRETRLSFYLIVVVGVPIILCMNAVLHLWLQDVPLYAVSFTQLTIIFCMIDTLSGPLWTANQASGKVKWYMVIITCIILLNLPIAYLLLKFGISPIMVMATRVLLNGVVFLFRIIYLKLSIKFPIRKYAKAVLARISLFFASCLPLCILYKNFGVGITPQVQLFSISLFWVAIAGFFIMLNNSERAFIYNALKKRIFKR